MARKVSLITYDEHTGYTMEVSSLRVKPEGTRGTIVCDDVDTDILHVGKIYGEPSEGFPFAGGADESVVSVQTITGASERRCAVLKAPIIVARTHDSSGWLVTDNLSVLNKITSDIESTNIQTKTLNVSSMMSASSIAVDKSVQIFGNSIQGDVLSVNGNVRFVSNDKNAVDVTVKDGHIYADTLHARCITAKSGEGNQLINADNIEASYVETKTLSVELLDGALFDKENVAFITIKNNHDPQTLITKFPGTVLESCSDYKLVSTQQVVSISDTTTLGFSCNENSVIVGKWRAIMAVGIVKEVAWRGVVYLAVRMSY